MVVLSSALTVSAAAAPPRVANMNVERVYERFCADCHGKDLHGGMASSLVDGKWVHGGSDDAIFRSIAIGDKSLGMSAFQETLTDEQIRAMVIYFREQETKVARASAPAPRPIPNRETHTRHHTYRVETVVEDGLSIPWAIAFLPDGRKLVTERPGPLRIIRRDGTLHPEPVRGTPPVIHRGQGGMMEVALHPEYAQNGWIYLGFSAAPQSGPMGNRCMTAVIRGRIRDHAWVDQEWIFRSDDRFLTDAGVHFGTRFVFADGCILFVVGERGGWHEAQDLARPNGKIFRLRDDGAAPDDNPFVGGANAMSGIWSYGHRNPQGLALDPRQGDLYSTEHGPRGGDELNLIRRGRNYGWPVITHGMNYNGKPITDKTHQEGMEQPIIHWTPSIAVCGLDFYDGNEFAGWKYDLFAGALRQEQVVRLRLQERRVVEQEVILEGIGRVRDVAAAPDGFLYVVLNKPDRIVRLVPVR